MKLRRTYRAVRLVGRHRYLTIKWLHPGVQAIRAGLWQLQVGRLLVRLSRTLTHQR